jgi:hypothetical protein
MNVESLDMGQELKGSGGVLRPTSGSLARVSAMQYMHAYRNRRYIKRQSSALFLET